MPKNADEDNNITFTQTDFTNKFSDPDLGDTLTKIRIDSLPVNGTLELSGSSVAIVMSRTI